LHLFLFLSVLRYLTFMELIFYVGNFISFFVNISIMSVFIFSSEKSKYKKLL